MKTKISAKKIVSKDNVDVYYWITYKQGMNNKFKFLHPASSMNHTSLEPLEFMLNYENHPTIILEPRGVGYSQTPNSKAFFQLDFYSDDISEILKAEGIEKPDFIGHSTGFMPSIDYAYRTNNADKIFGIGGSYHFPDTTASKLIFHFFNRVFRYNELVVSPIMFLWHNANSRLRPYNDQS
ncbi:TPA: alpha/beta hydrolase [Candidatus Woesearchaeota archaeon]|nr:alpha/beta hydrolase [Candidatus Woesearchaeota archaeon]